MEGFNRLFLKMGGLPNRINYYIPADRLLEIFYCIEPANGALFQKIIEDDTRECLESYRKMAETTDRIIEQVSKKEDVKQSNAREIMARWVKRRNLPLEEYILNEVKNQVIVFKDPSKASLEVAQSLGKIMIRYKKELGYPFEFKSCDKAKEKISSCSGETGFGLRETAWEAIDNETDLDILTMLALYADLNIQADSSWKWRSFILESPDLWPAMRDTFLNLILI
jgi:hypothetical protein